MTRFKLRAMFALGGLIVGATIWASAGISQENTPVPGIGLPGSGGLAPGPATTPPAAVEPATPGTAPPRVDPDWLAEPASSPW
jgi:hypothetical protein